MKKQVDEFVQSNKIHVMTTNHLLGLSPIYWCDNFALTSKPKMGMGELSSYQNFQVYQRDQFHNHLVEQGLSYK